MLKNGAFSNLLEAIKAVSKGEIYLSSGISGTIVQAYLSNAAPSDPLSFRERQVLQLIAEGKSMKEAGSVLGISARTAETHRGRIMEKLNIFNIAGLVRYALRNGFIIEREEQSRNNKQLQNSNNSRGLGKKT